ncbi:TPA: hypothetical protein ACH3X2_001946 [Trebouxia sp. C0005]
MEMRQAMFHVVGVLLLISGTPTGASQASRKLLSNGCAAAFHQCGGEMCPADSSTCSDTAYACCPSGYGCQRLTQLYWQCLPNTDKPGTVATRSVLASSSSSGELQDLSAPFGGTEGQALDKHIELPDYLTARAEGLLLKEH